MSKIIKFCSIFQIEFDGFLLTANDELAGMTNYEFKTQVKVPHAIRTSYTYLKRYEIQIKTQ